MTISAKVVADSTGEYGGRLITFILEYPRWIHSEFMTHRVFSRNAASSRAIPIDTMIQKVIDDPAMPVHWGKNQKGMQASEELTEEEIEVAKSAWLDARDRAVESARQLQALGLHKQLVNRTIENFMHIKVICTGTDYDNFFALRDHPDAQPEIRELARCMKVALSSSVTTRRYEGGVHDSWHMPFVTEEERIQDTCRHNLIRSVARCARVSYDRVEGGLSTLDNDIRIFKQLTQSVPAHSSPLEHQAIPGLGKDYYNLFAWKNLRWVSDKKTGLLAEMSE